jgi:hypothetical protein
MNRKLFAFSLVFALLLPSVTLFAGEIEVMCFTNSFGQDFRLSGGKIAKKPYLVEFYHGPCGYIPGLATSMKDSSGNIILAIHVADSDACAPIVWYFVGDPDLLSATGTFDNYPRNAPPHGADSITRINCVGSSTVGRTMKSVVLPSNAPGIEKK